MTNPNLGGLIVVVDAIRTTGEGGCKNTLLYNTEEVGLRIHRKWLRL